MKLRGTICAALSLLEILIAVAVIVILATLTIPVISGLRARAQRVQCAANLRNLVVAANAFVQQNGSWPQIGTPEEDESSERGYASAWIKALEPFGAPAKTWICPTIQDLLKNPDYSKPENARVDYIGTPFDDKPTTPHQWPRQPWFVEIGDVHGNGNLIIFTDGSVSDLKTVAKSAKK